tara:strand:- start:1625 stop:3112 length:1488 start_codon:yes stop_codon:yes gene_type:complete
MADPHPQTNRPATSPTGRQASISLLRSSPYRDNPDYPNSTFGGLDVAYYNANVPEGSSRVQASLEEAIRNLRPEDLAAVVGVANNIGLEPIAMLAILHEESAGTMDPGIPMIDGRSSATGALQFLTADKLKEDGGGPGVAETIGVPGNTWRDRRRNLQDMSLAEYMGYVQKYFEQPYAEWMNLSPEDKAGPNGAIRAYQAVHAGKVGGTAREAGDDGKKTEDVFPAIMNRYNALREMNLDLGSGTAPPRPEGAPRQDAPIRTARFNSMDGELWTNLINLENQYLGYLGEPKNATYVQYYLGKPLAPFLQKLNELALRSGQPPQFNAQEKRFSTPEEIGQYTPEALETFRKEHLVLRKRRHGVPLTDEERLVFDEWEHRTQRTATDEERATAKAAGERLETSMEEGTEARRGHEWAKTKELLEEDAARKETARTMDNRMWGRARNKMAEQFGVTRERQALDLDTPEERGQEAHGFISKADVGYRPSPEELAKLQGE